MVFYFRRYFLVFVSIIIVLFVACLDSYAIRIATSKLAYVNIEKIFLSSKKTRGAKSELKQLVARKKKEVEEIERAIASVRNKISKEEKNTIIMPEKPAPIEVIQPAPITSTETASEIGISTESLANVNIATAAAAAAADAIPQAPPEPSRTVLPTFEIDQMKKILTEKEDELKKTVEDSKRLISEREEVFQEIILSEIYEAVKYIANKEGYTVIFDKEIVLYSETSVKDITDQVLRRLDEYNKKNKN